MTLSSCGQTIAAAHLRIARPTDQLEAVVAFYRTMLGFVELGRFQDHQGFDGVMLGHAGQAYHLEFTSSKNHRAGRAPTEDNLPVFYIADEKAFESLVRHFEEEGQQSVRSFNPYWDWIGVTFEDPDGYRVVMCNAGWENAAI